MGGYWITNKGNILEVDHKNGQHHADLAFDYYLTPELFDPNEFESEAEARDDDFVRGTVMEAAIDDGWIRITTSRREMGVELNSYKTDKTNIRKLMNLVNKDQEYDRYVLNPGRFNEEYHTKRQFLQRFTILLLDFSKIYAIISM